MVKKMHKASAKHGGSALSLCTLRCSALNKESAVITEQRPKIAPKITAYVCSMFLNYNWLFMLVSSKFNVEQQLAREARGPN